MSGWRLWASVGEEELARGQRARPDADHLARLDLRRLEEIIALHTGQPLEKVSKDMGATSS